MMHYVEYANIKFRLVYCILLFFAGNLLRFDAKMLLRRGFLLSCSIFWVQKYLCIRDAIRKFNCIYMRVNYAF